MAINNPSPEYLGQKLNMKTLISILDDLPQFVCLIAPDFTISYFNRVFQQIFGNPAQQKCYEVMKKNDRPCPNCPVHNILPTQEPFSWELTTLAGRVYSVNGCYFYNETNTRYILKTGIDITDKKKIEYDMTRFDRLNLIAEMAAGIAHEIRNPLTTVKGFLQMLGWKSELKQYQDYYNLMINELERANSLITEFLSLTKNQNEDLVLQNLNAIIKTLTPLIQADALRSEITIVEELGEIKDIPLNPKEIRQLILNLVRNGIEAMETGKDLKIKTYMDLDQVVLAISDQGKGIEPEVLAKLGVPFFTTKEAGTGLGLMICKNIVKHHNARMDIVTSSKGTTFHIRFPA